jgi:diaminopimelate epimerase
MEFYKYHGTGNDFILIDARNSMPALSTKKIALLCDRRFGIGADGLMLLTKADGFDFGMVYYNADGRESSMCGNGGRCIVALAHKLGVIASSTKFVAIDGIHEAELLTNDEIQLKMNNVEGVAHDGAALVLNTGSPHYVLTVSDVLQQNVVAEGRAIRQNPTYAAEGINVNFMQQTNETSLFVRTYERGVEDETLSCGTGVVAAAIAATGNRTGIFNRTVQTRGGLLKASFVKLTPTSAEQVLLTGPATFVYHGYYSG